MSRTLSERISLGWCTWSGMNKSLVWRAWRTHTYALAIRFSAVHYQSTTNDERRHPSVCSGCQPLIQNTAASYTSRELHHANLHTTQYSRRARYARAAIAWYHEQGLRLPCGSEYGSPNLHVPSAKLTCSVAH